MKCYKHPDIDAYGVCADCGRTLCSACSVNIGGKARCAKCVEKMHAGPSIVGKNIKEPYLALALAVLGNGLILCNGLGAVYNGQFKKGVIITIINWVLWTLTGIIFIVVFMYMMGWGVLFAVIVMIFPVIYSACVAYEAYTTAKTVNAGEKIRDWLV